MDTILVINSGSSSLKFEAFRIGTGKELDRLVKGEIDGIGVNPRLRAKGADGSLLIDRTFELAEVADIPAAIRAAGAWLRETHMFEATAVGHRVVHGGPDFDQPVLLNADVVQRLERYVSLAPLHQPNNLAPICFLLEHRPELPQVACFDTAFHRNHGELADHFAIPLNFHAEGIRRYGFHGLSYEYIAHALPSIAPGLANGKVIAAHLGSGASLCALSNGRSIDSTMGFSALDGLPMGTRPGQIDPGVILHLIIEKGMDPAKLQNFLYKECGLKGLSGISNDMRVLETSDDPRAAFAIEYFAHRIGLHAGMLAAALGGLDAFVFTAGIGENSAGLRARVAEKLSWLGAALDPGANEAHKTLISKEHSRVALYVVPTDEELMIARHTLALLSSGAAKH